MGWASGSKAEEAGLSVGSKRGRKRARPLKSGLDEADERNPYCIKKDPVRGKSAAPVCQRRRILMTSILQIAPDTLFDQDLRRESLNIEEDDFYLYV
jgi:hypothetical protein